MRFLLCNDSDRQSFIEKILQFPFEKNKRYLVEWKLFRRKRTLGQNSLFHALVGCINKESEEGRGFTFDELKEYFISKFSPCYIKVFNGQEITFHKRTHNHNTKEMTTLIDGVYRDGLIDFQVDLPRPDDKRFDDFYAKYWSY